MDANGQRFWLLGEATHFPSHAHTAWDTDCRRLRLASERTLTPALAPAAAFTAAQEALERIPRAVDTLECVARWDADSGAILVRSVLPDEAVLLALDATPTDLCNGADGVLYILLPGAVLLHDLRGRWADVRVALPGFTPWRAAPAADGGVWLMERGTGRLARLTGRPRRTETPQPDDYDPRVFRPSPENACAPQIRLLAGPPGDGSENAVALASGPDGALALLSWATDGAPRLRRWRAEAQHWDLPHAPQGAAYAHALAWLAPDRIALRVPGRRDAPAWQLGATPGPLAPLGEVYPLAPDALEARFCNGPVQPPCYPVGTAGAEPLHALSLHRFAAQGEARNYADGATGLVARLIDSGDTTTVWHRLFAEAVLPAHTGFVAWLAATNEPAPPADDDRLAWHAHLFGSTALAEPQLPQAVWEPVPSELPHHPGLLGGAKEPGRAGLFSVLVQNSRQRVRHLAGRYLWLRLALQGDGHATPEIAALRVWGNRFSYVDHYLPRLYRESQFGSAASAPGERLATIDLVFGDALDAADAGDVALRGRLLLEQVMLGAAASIAVERAGQAWLLQDGASAWRLRREADGIAIYRPRATPADFNARLLANFEGVLTRLEDRVASAHLLSDPALADDGRLDWLAGWIGVAFDPALPSTRRREWLRGAPDLARWHGTRRGLQLALDIATGGAVRGGEVLVVEDFRLRRILATLLGVDLADEHDPLLPGLQVSGNSVVGDTLFVGEQARAELAALFNAGQLGAAGEQAALAFDAELAHRATVLVHQAVEPQDLGLIRRIAQREAPAHVELRVAQASWPLLVGIASLVGVDTYLGPPRLPRPVQVQASGLGLGDVLVSAAVLDPRLAGAPATAAPEADAGPPQRALPGASFWLDGSGSRAAPGRQITAYRWRWLASTDP